MNGETARGAPPVDLTNCDREPIHVPGAIQPHGDRMEMGHTTLDEVIKKIVA